MKVNQTAGLAESTFIVNALDILELSSVEIEGTDAEWVHKTIKHALAASEDVPTIKEALHGTEKHDWSLAIDAKLAQIEKLSTWEIIEAPTDTNIIPCHYVLR
ncbi:hypothetical protein C0995_002345, partial [Termitomyces sp. Mi166